jgi:hypothetical protein
LTKVEKLEERVNRMGFGSEEKRAYDQGATEASLQFARFLRSLPGTVQSAIFECLDLEGAGGDMNCWYTQVIKKARDEETLLQSRLGEGSTILKCNACGQVYCSKLLMADHCVRNHTSPTPKE